MEKLDFYGHCTFVCLLPHNHTNLDDSLMYFADDNYQGKLVVNTDAIDRPVIN